MPALSGDGRLHQSLGAGQVPSYGRRVIVSTTYPVVAAALIAMRL
jgi:hypothetical protein